MRDKIAVSDIRLLLQCNFETGDLIWRERPVWRFSDGAQSAYQNCRAWNGKHAGKAAFVTNLNGYLVGRVFRHLIPAHRVVLAIKNGEWPPEHVDHIDGNPANNAIKNLRCVTVGENMRNSALREDNTSGCVGVSWNRRCGKWQAKITQDKKTRFLGSFSEYKDAVSARHSAQEKLDFSERHGKQAHHVAQVLSAFGIEGDG
jgi:hypothetical protein